MAKVKGTDQKLVAVASKEEGPPEIKATSIEEDFVPKQRSTIVGVELEGESVLLDKVTLQVHHLDQIASIVWNSLDGSVSLDQLITEISEAFEADREVIHKDVMNLIRRFGRAGLLEGVKAEELAATNPNAIAPGEEVPTFELPDFDGRLVALEDFRGQQFLLVNWSPSCGFCERIAPELASLQAPLSEHDTELVFITVGDIEANKEQFERHGLGGTILVQQSGQVQFFATLGTPVAYLVDAEGKVAQDLAMGADQVPVLARAVAGQEEPEAS